MKTPRPERCWCCGAWAVLTWSVAPIRCLCDHCHAGIVRGVGP